MSVADSAHPRPEVLLARVDLALEVGEFENWATTRHISKLIVCSPKSLEEVQSVVKAATKLKVGS